MKQFMIEKEFEHEGLQCVVLFLPVGHRTGYVGVPNGHPFFGREYDEIDGMISVHGGLTYSGKDDGYPVPSSDLWWFGFDCAHAGDGKDLDLAKRMFPEHTEIDFMIQMERQFPMKQYETMRSLDYVEEECKDLAKQLSTLPIKELEGGEDHDNTL